VTVTRLIVIPEAFPSDVEALGPPLNAPSIGIRGIPGGFTGGSPNLIQFSTVPRIQGEYNVKEGFVELNVPLFETSHGQKLGSDLAYRKSSYSGIGSVNAYKGGLDFQAYSDLRFRATLSCDVREATFSERFDFQGGGGTVNDPEAVGVGGARNQSFQITAVNVGNPPKNGSSQPSPGAGTSCRRFGSSRMRSPSSAGGSLPIER
jgi:hypothetical protein